MMSMLKRQRPIIVAMVGNVLESYNVILYGYFAALISPLFFPSNDPVISSLAAMGAFAMSFVMRPLGGIIFGHFGDKVGRKKTLFVSIMLMSFPTMMIGFLPTYHSIGIFAPIILLLSIFVQGMCAGGAYSGAAVFINEHAKKGRKGFASSLLSTSGFFGAILVTGIGALVTLRSMPVWGWRVPFVLGGIMGIALYILCRNVDESPAFRSEEKKEKGGRAPFLNVLINQKKNILCAMGIGGSAFIPFYTLSIFMNMFLTTKVKMPPSEVMLINMSTMILWVLFLPIMGHVSDKIGGKRLMRLGAAGTALVSYPLFYILSENFTLSNLFLLQIGLSFTSAAFVAPSSAFLPTLFKVKERYTGVAFSYFLGVALLGGTTPLIQASILEYTGSLLSPAFYVAFGGVLGFLSVTYGKQVSS